MISTSWKGGSGGWNTAANWSGGVPNSSAADATIAAVGDYVVTIGAKASFTVDSLTIDNGNATLDLLGSLTLAGSSETLIIQAGVLELAGEVVGGAVSVDAGGTLLDKGGRFSSMTSFNLESGGLFDLDGRTLTIAGVAQLAGNVSDGHLLLKQAVVDHLALANGATVSDRGTVTQEGNIKLGISGTDTTELYIAGGAFYHDQAGGAINAAGTASILNDGLFEVGGAIGTSIVYAVFNNAGTIDVTKGTLELSAGGSLTGKLSGAGELDLNGGTFELGFNHTLNVATLALSAGELAVDSNLGAPKTLVVTGMSTFGFEFYQRLDGQSDFDNATIKNLASQMQILTIAGSSTIENLAIANNTGLYITGNATQIGNLVLDPGDSNTPLTLGSDDMISNGTIVGLVSETITSDDVEKTGGTGVSVIEPELYNNGTVLAESGTLLLHKVYNVQNGDTLFGKDWEVYSTAASGATLALFTADPLLSDQTAHIILSGAGAEIESGPSAATSIEDSLKTIGSIFEILNGKTYVTTNTVKVVGALVVTGGTFDAAALVVGSTDTAGLNGLIEHSTIVQGGFEFVISGGLASGSTVAGGTQEIGPGGAADGTLLRSGGDLYVSGGTARYTVIENGGVGTILAHGEVRAALVSGEIDASSFGVIQDSTIAGLETIGAGGTALSNMINGGVEMILSGGVASGSVIGNGGLTSAYSGAMVSGETIAAGGTLDLVSGAIASDGITFTGNSGMLILESRMLSTTSVVGFAVGDQIKLPGLLSSGAIVSVETAGVVTVISDRHDYNINIAGAKVGETDFAITSNSDLVRVSSPGMDFMAPRHALAVTSGGFALPSLADVPFSHVASHASLVGRPAASPSAGQADPGADLLAVIHRGGTQTLLSPHLHAGG